MKTSIWEKTGSIAEAFWKNGRADFPIYDMHGHMGRHYGIFMARSDPASMVRHMKRIGVRRFCFSHHEALMGTESNRHTAEICREYPDILRMYVGINPNFPERMRQDLRCFDQWQPCAIGLKFLPDYHKVALTDPAYEYALDFASERGLPILMHTWSHSPYDGGEVTLELVTKWPKVKFFAGHSICGAWDYAQRCVKESAGNVWLELTAIPGECGLIEKLVGMVGSERLLYGTDMPWFDEYQAVGGVISADISEDDMRNILYRNVERILGKDW